MEASLPFFNWSLKSLLATEPDSFKKAKIKIVFTILVFSLIKIFIAIPSIWHHHQYLQFARVLVILSVYIVLFKLLLANRAYMNVIPHVMIWLGLMLIWTSVIFYARTVNIIMLQLVFMIMLSSFYVLGNLYGTLYSSIGTLPIIIYLVAKGVLPQYLGSSGLPSPGYEIIVILNFITIIISHILFQQAFRANIAEKEVINQELQVAVREANQAAQSKTDFLSTMSHELRTPLNSVIGMAELLQDDPDSDESAENIKILHFSAVSLHSLINDILDFNKMGSDKLNLEAISVNLFTLMKDICSGLRLQAKEKVVNLVLDMDDALTDKYIITDPTRISQIIYNLTGNAIKFTANGTVSVRLKVLSSDDDSIRVQFSIVDTGIGISTDKQEAIFEPFTQASSSTTRNFGGTGLGLAIVKKLLTLFDSKINLESTPGVGSNFFFEISFSLDKQPAAVYPVNAEPDYDLSALRVLIAEDNPMNRLLMKKVFSKWNNMPVFAVNGQEAVEKATCEVFDVILMDIHMPIKDGYEATRAIRNLTDDKRSSIPIIALTASVSNNLYEKITDAGMNDYVFKPFKSKELHGKLNTIALRAQTSFYQ